MKRRKFLEYGAGFIPLFGGAAIAATPSSTELGNFKAILSSFIDVLVPKDETPAASELGVDRQVLQYSNVVKHYKKLIELGCYWLELQSQASFKLSFIDLSEQQKIDIVTKLETAKVGSIEQQFFDRVLSDSFRFYYGNSASWALLPINIPPQPVGYPNYSFKGMG